jgi:tRNA A-37 threonylcarbamoyl transferase component Bud32
VREVGRKIAEAHELDVSLGDCKPENFIVTKNGKIVFLDLEQASRDGDKTWDVAEFLYYSGHYSSPVSSSNAASIIARNFIEGYLEAGGKKETVKKAASARYTKVFSVFTPLHVIRAISNVCQKMGNDQVKDKSKNPLTVE